LETGELSAGRIAYSSAIKKKLPPFATLSCRKRVLLSSRGVDAEPVPDVFSSPHRSKRAIFVLFNSKNTYNVAVRAIIDEDNLKGGEGA
jgi:hypothetical protein